MKKTKAILYFRDYTAAELGPVAQFIHDRMSENAATFPEPPVTMGALQTRVTTYEERLASRASGATADVIALKQAREALEQSLNTLGQYVNSVAKGSAVIVEQSGFPSYGPRSAPDTSPPAAPTDLRLRHGTASGSIVLRYRSGRRKGVHEVQTTTGDPNDEAGWQTAGMFHGGRAEMSGFTPGSLLWVRVRAVGLRGVMGVWSDPAQIRVL